MTSLMSVLAVAFFGGKKSVETNKRNRRQGRRSLRVESLERREMLAGGVFPLPPPIPVPVGSVFAQVANQSVPRLTILPGGIDKVLARESITVKGGVAQLTEMDFVAVNGYLWDATSIRLMADVDGRASNGCETALAYSYGWNTYSDGVLRMNLTNQTFWVGATARKVELVASFQTTLQSDGIGVQLAAAGFSDLNGQALPAANVKYTGVKPVVHTLQSNAVYFSQSWRPETATAFAGQKDVHLFNFQAWTRYGDKPTLVQSMDFVAAQGDLKNATNYSLWVTKGTAPGGYLTTCLQQGVKPMNGKVSFNKAFVLDNGYQFEVRADIANTLTKDPRISLVFGSGFKARELKTGKQLRGVAINGGEGQIQVYGGGQSPVFNLKSAPAPGLHISEIGSGYGWTVSTGAQGLVFDAFNVYAKGNSAYITQVVINAAQGSLGSCASYVLMGDSNGDGYIDSRDNILATGNVVGDSVVFDTNIYVSAGTTSRLEVHANVLATSTGMSLQTTLKSVAATVAVDYIHRDQPNWFFYDYGNGGGGGMG